MWPRHHWRSKIFTLGQTITSWQLMKFTRVSTVTMSRRTMMRHRAAEKCSAVSAIPQLTTLFRLVLFFINWYELYMIRLASFLDLSNSFKRTTTESFSSKPPGLWPTLPPVTRAKLVPSSNKELFPHLFDFSAAVFPRSLNRRSGH